jgi:hypothetical protein
LPEPAAAQQLEAAADATGAPAKAAGASNTDAGRPCVRGAPTRGPR